MKAGIQKENMELKPTNPTNAVCMSPTEWAKTHSDFKTRIDGQRFVLRMTSAGTALVPVQITKKESKK
ncbi:hypothetical protein [Roseateles albus]|uniref:hypothetical protein n=1 Tax=Roseateles albus TaxID=2987525 RepID=UPI002359D984|nr:hypothetical protein [Roseateles albus]